MQHNLRVLVKKSVLSYHHLEKTSMNRGLTMKRLVLVMTMMLIVFLMTSCTKTRDYEKAEGMLAHTEAYASYEGIDSNLTSMDIYYDPSFDDVPVVFFIHGGALMNGDKANRSHEPKSHAFVNAGMVFVSINYRLYPDVGLDAIMNDVTDALSHVYEHIRDFGGNPEHVFLMGHSAGAYLSALLSTNQEYVKNAGLDPDILQGVILLDTNALVHLPDWVLQTIADSDRTQETPYLNIEDTERIPPTLLIINDKRDDHDTIAYVNKLLDHDHPAGYVRAKGDDHADVSQDIGTTGDSKTTLIVDFMASPESVESIVSAIEHLVS